MSELDDCLIIHVFGETDYTSFVYPKSAFEGREKIFGTPKADIFIRTVGALLGFDNWDELKHKPAAPGTSYEEALSQSVAHLVAGADNVKFALENGYNLVMLGAFRGPDDEAGSPVFNARFLGVSRTTSTDVEVHAGLARDGMIAMAQMLRDDIETGMFSRTGIVSEILSALDGTPIDHAEDETKPLPNMVVFHEMVSEKGLETMVVCACDPDLAAAVGNPDRPLVVGLVASLVPTPHGEVGYWIWQFAPDQPYGFIQEQFVDPRSLPNASYDRLTSAEHVRILVLDRNTRENTRAVLMETAMLGLKDFEHRAIEASKASPEGDFSAACEYVMTHIDAGEFLQNMA